MRLVKPEDVGNTRCSQNPLNCLQRPEKEREGDKGSEEKSKLYSKEEYWEESWISEETLCRSDFSENHDAQSRICPVARYAQTPYKRIT